MKRTAFVFFLLFVASVSFAQITLPGGDSGPKATIEGSLQKRTGAAAPQTQLR